MCLVMFFQTKNVRNTFTSPPCFFQPNPSRKRKFHSDKIDFKDWQVGFCSNERTCQHVRWNASQNLFEWTRSKTILYVSTIRNTLPRTTLGWVSEHTMNQQTETCGIPKCSITTRMFNSGGWNFELHWFVAHVECTTGWPYGLVFLTLGGNIFPQTVYWRCLFTNAPCSIFLSYVHFMRQACNIRDILRSGKSFCMTSQGHRALLHPPGGCGTFWALLMASMGQNEMWFWRSFCVASAIFGELGIESLVSWNGREIWFCTWWWVQQFRCLGRQAQNFVDLHHKAVQT